MTEVDVVTGKVRFAAGKGEPVILTAGMSASYSNEKKIDIEGKSDMFLENEAVGFNDTPLEKVIKDLEQVLPGGDHQQKSGFAGFQN